MSLNKDELVVNGVYLVDARNYSVAIWDGEKFLGPSLTAGHLELVPEWDYSEGYPRGTATATRKLEPLNILPPYGMGVVTILELFSQYILENQ